MKIEFDDGSYIELSKIDSKIFISIAATDPNNKNKKFVNSVELTKEQYKSIIISDI